MKLNLSGRRALVCGSTQGIGLAIAQTMAEAGAVVTLLARSKASLAAAMDTLEGEGHDYLVADFSDFEELTVLREEIEHRGFDILVNNAGGPPPGNISEAEWPQFEFALDMHLKASHHLTQWVLPAMREKGFGRVINVISTSVKIPIPGLGVSNTVRGAMASWAKSMSNEVARDGITVNNILPGPIETGRLHAILSNQSKAKGISEEEAAYSWKQSVPAGRFGRPEELGALATFLASDMAGYINGTSIPIDGGRTGSI